MDSIPRSPCPAQNTPEEVPGEPVDDPYSPGPQPLPFLLGTAIALLTVTVPLLTVVSGRSTVMGNPSVLNPQSVGGSAAPSAFSADAAEEILRSPGPETPGPDRQNRRH
jgi:hypothetical protein